MNIAELSIKKSVITWVLTILLVVVGGSSFFNLSWLEDPEFTIKEAVIMTPYPGASAAEVEEEVTNILEKALQVPTREAIQQQSDVATFERRALAVESERAIREIRETDFGAVLMDRLSPVLEGPRPASPARDPRRHA